MLSVVNILMTGNEVSWMVGMTAARGFPLSAHVNHATALIAGASNQYQHP
jgi:hypothetical protein